MICQLRDPKLLTDYLADRDFTQARLARRVGCGRQFINKLANGTKAGCSERIATAIEVELQLLPGTLFTPKESSQAGRSVASEANVA